MVGEPDILIILASKSFLYYSLGQILQNWISKNIPNLPKFNNFIFVIIPVPYGLQFSKIIRLYQYLIILISELFLYHNINKYYIFLKFLPIFNDINFQFFSHHKIK